MLQSDRDEFVADIAACGAVGRACAVMSAAGARFGFQGVAVIRSDCLQVENAVHVLLLLDCDEVVVDKAGGGAVGRADAVITAAGARFGFQSVAVICNHALQIKDSIHNISR